MNNSLTSNNINVFQREEWVCQASGDVITSKEYFEKLKEDKSTSPAIASSPSKEDMERRSQKLRR